MGAAGSMCDSEPASCERALETAQGLITVLESMTSDPGTHIHLKDILSEEIGQSYFNEFLVRHYAGENMYFLQSLEKLKKMTEADMLEASDRLVARYVIPDAPQQVNISAALSTQLSTLSKDANESMTMSNEIFDALASAEQEIMTMMILGWFQRFIESPLFVEYIANNAFSLKERSLPQGDLDRLRVYVAKDIEKMNNGEPVKVVYNLCHRPPVPENTMLSNVFRSSQDIMGLLNDGDFHQETFFDKFVALMQNVNVCVSLADADVNNRGFPILWVNAEFESTTGFSAADLEGKNFTVMQKQNASFDNPMRSEADSIKHFASALRQFVPTRVRITNFRKDGTPWVNLMAIKPIFFDDKAKYVVGMQFDVAAQGAIGKFALLNELMASIPDVVYPAFRR